MQPSFDTTMTGADFQRPLLDANEARLAREMRGDADFSVDGLRSSFLSQLLALFGIGKR